MRAIAAPKYVDLIIFSFPSHTLSTVQTLMLILSMRALKSLRSITISRIIIQVPGLTYPLGQVTPAVVSPGPWQYLPAAQGKQSAAV